MFSLAAWDKLLTRMITHDCHSLSRMITLLCLVLLQRFDVVARISANGSAALNENVWSYGYIYTYIKCVFILELVTVKIWKGTHIFSFCIRNKLFIGFHHYRLSLYHLGQVHEKTLKQKYVYSKCAISISSLCEILKKVQLCEMDFEYCNVPIRHHRLTTTIL